ncbi:CDP-alcohol phosphatidyltransferase family protein [Halogeometricum sp. S1BR25-6]|uniref:CDP-alcohol phosphatidyltransferase family protein n=1 Tax=Halogeometricum salsisoli TaxID=2950536 RepID=A0ABU2G972_9EURY|nr:CDP-alcohol phosphatidyltransferase family protein [Halogeometricum sp. S1BR25-6]MDS0297341.1 CDP-alcohol phosphatidyltransferase family protein [Halogeometricum sp. S1BR25-6]
MEETPENRGVSRASETGDARPDNRAERLADEAAPPRTARQLAALAVGFLACVGVVAVLVERRAPGAGLPWAVLSGAGVAAVVGLGRRNVGLNRPPEGGRPFDTLGVANAVTLFRGALVASLAGLLAVHPPVGWFPAVLYGAVAALDALDGAIARARGRRTLLGAWLDMNVDAAGLLAAAVVGVAAGSLPPWYPLVGAARYLFVAGAWVRRQRGLPVFDLPHSTSRRVLAGGQMAATAVLLAPVVPHGAAWAAATATMLPFLANFLLDWFVVTGRRERPLP